MKTKPMSDFEIASRIKRGDDFKVNTEPERKKALAASRFLGVMVKTFAAEQGGFVVCVPKTK